MPTDNFVGNAQTSVGDTFRVLVDGASLYWPASVAAYATTVSNGANVLQEVTPLHGLPVQPATSSTWAISAASLPLPAGASTAAKQPALGTAGTASTDVLTIQGIAGMTALAVSAASLPLPAGASTAAKQPAIGTAGTASTDVVTIQGIAGMTVLAVSAASLPLPAGASTAAKQPALGTAGTASTDVLTIQGIAGMTALKVDGSAVTQPVNILPATSGGLSVSRLISALNTNATVAKASAGQVYGFALYNTNAANRWLKLYNKATSPTIGTDTPVATILIPPPGNNFNLPGAIAFSAGIAFGLTTGEADNDTGAVGAGDVVVNIFYK